MRQIILWAFLGVILLLIVAAIAFAAFNRHHLSPELVIKGALSKNNNNYITDLFLNSDYYGGPDNPFDRKNCINNHCDLPTRGYLLVSIRPQIINKNQIIQFSIKGICPDALFEVVIRDPYRNIDIKTYYPCKRVGFLWYIMESWIKNSV